MDAGSARMVEQRSRESVLRDARSPRLSGRLMRAGQLESDREVSAGREQSWVGREARLNALLSATFRSLLRVPMEAGSSSSSKQFRMLSALSCWRSLRAALRRARYRCDDAELLEGRQLAHRVREAQAVQGEGFQCPQAPERLRERRNLRPHPLHRPQAQHRQAAQGGDARRHLPGPLVAVQELKLHQPRVAGDEGHQARGQKPAAPARGPSAT